MDRNPLRTGRIYHIYNRGVEKRETFPDPSYYKRFIFLLKHYLKYDYPYSTLLKRLKQSQTEPSKQTILKHLEQKRIKPPVDIISFCLMPNHYHITLKQRVKDGISFFMHKIGVAYTNYFNIRLERTGRLFEGPYKSVLIESNEQLVHLTRYQHINPRKLRLESKNKLVEYPWSSLSTYLEENYGNFINPQVVTSLFKSPREYLEFVMAEVDEFEPLRLETVALDDDFGWFQKFRSQKKAYKKHLREQFKNTL
ncbi:MAG: transposase [Patescibacteria group bacterium]|nr:transposase [Patescibacteria group bacterium]